MTLRLNPVFASAVLSALLTLSGAATADTKVRTTSFDYEAATGLLAKTTSEPTVANNCLQVSVLRDTFGNPTSSSTATCAGATGDAILSAATPRTSTSNFGTDGRFALTSSNALSQTETRVYNQHSGTLASLTGPNGLTTSWLYDSLNRKTKETRADGTTTTWAYQLCTDAGANCPAPIAGAVPVMVAVEQSYAANAVVSLPQSRTYIDALGRTLRSQTQGFDGQGAAPTLVADTEYNALGQVARQSNRYVLGGTPVWTSFTYDVLGRVTRQEQPDPDAPGGVAVTTTSYNGLSFTITNSKSQTKTTTKNTQGLILQVVDNAGSSIVYSYDVLGQLTQTNAAGSITSMGYNQRGQRISMLDPSIGVSDYRYNVFDELVSTADSGGHTVTIAYDQLGRMTKRTEADLVSDWSYDKKFDGTACGKGVGKLCEAKAANGYVRKHTYDSLGRPSVMSTVLDNPAAPAVVTETYDVNTGRVASKTWPSGYQASYLFSPLGYLKKVTGGGTAGFTQTVSYEVLAMNPQGQVSQYRQGNQVTTVRNFNTTSNRLTSQTATKDGQAAGNVLNHTYSYDSLDNLTARTDANLGTQESFSYDSLNRLSLSTILGGAVSPPSTTEVMYDARGNITYKSDVGRYWYDAQRPNRMTNVTLETAPGAQIALSGSRSLSYAFDDLKPGARNVNGVMVGNGNLEYTVSHDTVNNVHTVRGETYTSFNMPAQIQYGNFITSTTSTADRTLSWVYGPEHQRIKEQVALSGSGTSSYFAGSTWYLNGTDSLGLSYEKEIRTNGTIEQKHYVTAGGQVFALFVSRSGTLNGLPANSTSYMHQDHLSSVAVITDETGAVVERLAYDPWGKRRKIDGTRDKLDVLVGVRLDRGYTMHEHLDEVGIIHMNGRIYDPLIGRFMSADPYLQAPTNLKTFIRYSYVWNNPLKGYDPEGFLVVTGVGSTSCDEGGCKVVGGGGGDSGVFSSSMYPGQTNICYDASCGARPGSEEFNPGMTNYRAPGSEDGGGSGASAGEVTPNAAQQFVSDVLKPLGNALGSAVVDAMMPQNSAQQSFRSSEIAEQNAAEGESAQTAFRRGEIAQQNAEGVWNGGQAWATDVAARRAASPVYSAPIAQDEQLGGLNDINGMDAQSDAYAGGRRTITIGDRQSVLGSMGAAGLSVADQRAAYGQLIRTGQLSAADFDAKGMPIVQAGQQFYLDANDFTAGDARLGGRLIGAESSNRAAIAAAAATAAAAANRERWDALQAGAWSGRTNQVAATGMQSFAPEMDSSYYVAPGFITSSYNQGVGMMSNSQAPWYDRVIGGVAATAMAPMMLLEETGRALMNVPYHGNQMGQNAAQFALATDNDQRVVAGLKFVSNTSAGFLGAMAVVPGTVSMRAPVLTAQEMAVSQFAGAEVNAAARATYLGDVYSPRFVGPVQWEYYYRGDSTQRTSFLSSMAQERGPQASTEFLNSRTSGQLTEIFDTHGNVGSQGLPTIGASRDPIVADYFARGPYQNQEGFVTTFRIEHREAESIAFRNYENRHDVFDINPNIGRPEQEYLFRNQIDQKFIFEQRQVGPRPR